MTRPAAALLRTSPHAHARPNVETLLLMPHRDDWNTDLRELGPHQVFDDLAVQLRNEDAARFAGGSTPKT